MSKCGKCGVDGHNARTCGNADGPPPPPPPKVVVEATGTVEKATVKVKKLTDTKTGEVFFEDRELGYVGPKMLDVDEALEAFKAGRKEFKAAQKAAAKAAAKEAKAADKPKKAPKPRKPKAEKPDGPKRSPGRPKLLGNTSKTRGFNLEDSHVEALKWLADDLGVKMSVAMRLLLENIDEQQVKRLKKALKDSQEVEAA